MNLIQAHIGLAKYSEQIEFLVENYQGEPLENKLKGLISEAAKQYGIQSREYDRVADMAMEALMWSDDDG
ncbi:MAG: hypothetical protein VW683_10065 [Betaproteobacteria bacterium]